MPKLPLTKEQKRDKSLRDQLVLSQNRCLSEWNFGKISTWEGVFKAQGFGEDYIRQHLSDKKGTLTFGQLKEFLSGQRDKLEKEILELYATKIEQEREKETSSTIQAVIKVVDRSTKSTPNNDEIIDTKKQYTGDTLLESKEASKTVKTKLPGIDEDYGLHKSPHEHCSLFWFQKKSIKDGWDKLMI